MRCIVLADDEFAALQMMVVAWANEHGPKFSAVEDRVFDLIDIWEDDEQPTMTDRTSSTALESFHGVSP